VTSTQGADTPLPVAVTVDHLGTRADRPAGADEGEADPLLPAFDALRDVLRGKAVTVFVEGVHAVVRPEYVRAVAAEFEVGMHGWSHENWTRCDRLDLMARVLAGVTALNAIGCYPSGFRPPGGAANPEANIVLRRAGFRYQSALPIRQRAVRDNTLVNFSFQWSEVDYYLYSERTPALEPKKLARYWRRRLQTHLKAAQPAVFVVHAAVTAVQPARLEALATFLQMVEGSPDFELMTLATLRTRMDPGGPEGHQTLCAPAL
jgi:peptidoglycan/xylan/chitin deacetylase (PgdA/CDA1 family)